jgi:putative SOS response-associated peptidase YedK
MCGRYTITKDLAELEKFVRVICTRKTVTSGAVSWRW